MRLDQVTAGMLLAKNLHDPNGAILIRAGVSLTERHLKALKSWGIQQIPIQSAESCPQSLAVLDPSLIAEARTQLDTQFSLSNPDHPAVHALYEICLERTLCHR
ncbi:hypothetical protein CCR95_17290 [Thiocystis minor]|uniref:hypothetical protein n=1 Tax=Thiocystis minor TaxID=61597 RepID=UPI00191411B4|nr:hypothetical protein [Thiocystis minor]MBK5965784.1 hypothetical protein [Thiocystis minor]